MKLSIFKQDRGQTLVLLALLLIVVISVAGLVIDLGYAYHAQRQLQASADAAATAGALDLPNSAVNAVSNATLASGLAGDKNAVNTLYSVQMVKNYPLVTCFQPCSATLTTNCVPNVTEVPMCSYNGTVTGNVVVVEETGKSPTFFSKLMGFGSLTINVTSVAMAKGSAPLPINIMVVMDSTDSMNSPDGTSTSNDCWSTEGIPTGWSSGVQPEREDCAKWGIRTLLTGLNSSVQSVGLETFPPVNPSYDGDEYDCQNPTFPSGGSTCNEEGVVPYNCSQADSLIVPLSSDYLEANGSLSSSSNLVGAVYWDAPGKTCKISQYGVQIAGNEGTYYAQAINEAVSVLEAVTPKTASAIIVIGDGTINYKSSLSGNGGGQSGDNSPCTSAITAAHTAFTAGISVYSVGYGIPNPATTNVGGDFAQTGGMDKPPNPEANCGPGDSTLTPCDVMQQIASTYGATGNPNFYSDDTAGCKATANSGLTDLGSIFKGLAATLGNTRLLPSSSYTP
jgi:Flp pilus assembly protein TadG